jgi:hypothetical protein
MGIHLRLVTQTGVRLHTAASGKKIENYSGAITKFGADIGYQQSGVILWTVLAPGVKIIENPGLLAGHYGGVTASATVGLGLGGNVLIGGMDGSIALQPLSIEGTTGLNAVHRCKRWRLRSRAADGPCTLTLLRIGERSGDSP